MTYIKHFSQIRSSDLAEVGGKCAALGEMYNTLGKSSTINIPEGFAVTTAAFRYFLDANGLVDEIRAQLDGLDYDDNDAVSEAAGRIRAGILYGQTPTDLREAVALAYQSFNTGDGQYGEVAVRSSATAEDLPHASFAGQQDTFLNIRGTRNLDDACKKVMASLYTDRAISYRQHHNIVQTDVLIAIAVQRMVRSDLGSAGVMFTLDTESGFDNVVYITAAYGLGESVVQGIVNPDEYYVFKPALRDGCSHPIVYKRLGDKQQKMIYGDLHEAGQSTRLVGVQKHEQKRFVLDDDAITELARSAMAIEAHYSQLNQRSTPVDIEWAYDGISGKLSIVQTRPETVYSRKDFRHKTFKLLEKSEVLVEGRSIGQGVAAGLARVILSSEDMRKIKPGEVLVTEITDPDWEPVMKQCAAIVTDRGGRTCHAAIVAREIGIPAIVGCNTATEILSTGQPLTVSCAEGTVGSVRKGILKYEVTEHEWRNIAKTRTKLLLNIGDPSTAFALSSLPVDGVGLARQEFIVSSSIGVHPRAITQYSKTSDYTQYQIDKMSSGYDDPVEFYISKLAEGISTIACAFHPRPVVLRLSDFKSNEYRKLVGGEAYEPEEENPMLGFRGACRYFSEVFADCFDMECEAIRRVLCGTGLNNLALMVPFVRTPDEGARVMQLLEKNQLSRSACPDLKIYLMCELPANVVLADAFLDIFDGMSIGSNDLTQTTLGIDRDSGLLSGYDERSPAVLELFRVAIDACNQRNKYIGICGQAPSDFPEIARALVRMNIKSMSLNPDSVYDTMAIVADEEGQSSAA
ncbi:MAG: phosphoenolpyruvate synthase [Gammaproteobacteria bacterium]|nr:phosphoenolpyruvate synthase [Pseudomonadota bacterium]MCH9662103.1 phosphoenolpyruvate synthase [Gammaproteobacteria bacterium]